MEPRGTAGLACPGTRFAGALWIPRGSSLCIKPQCESNQWMLLRSAWTILWNSGSRFMRSRTESMAFITVE